MNTPNPTDAPAERTRKELRRDAAEIGAVTRGTTPTAWPMRPSPSR